MGQIIIHYCLSSFVHGFVHSPSDNLQKTQTGHLHESHPRLNLGHPGNQLINLFIDHLDFVQHRPQMSIFGKVTLVFFLSLLRCICCQSFGGIWKLWAFAGGATGTSESSHKCDPENENSCLDIGLSILSIIIALIEGLPTAATALRRRS